MELSAGLLAAGIIVYILVKKKEKCSFAAPVMDEAYSFTMALQAAGICLVW